MARCRICDAESSGLGAVPYKHTRRFVHDPVYPHLDVCSDCIDSVYEPPKEDFEEGEIENLDG